MGSFRVISFVTIFGFAYSSSLSASAPIIKLPNGQLQGSTIDHYFSYTNIPYAEPPGRFEPSKPLEAVWKGIRNGTGEMLRCVQFDGIFKTLKGQEDCLFLNVFTPKRPENQKRLPVFVYIHGGAFMFGGAQLYSPATIMTQGGMIVVSLNYRLGPLGFLTTEDGVIHGNLGLKDQLLALRWIKKNIHHFGGDPDRILLTGQSAGAASVHLHILRKETESLVSAAVALSGTALNPWAMQQDSIENTKTLAKHLNCSMHFGGDMKSCLKDQSLENLHAAVLKMLTFLDNPFSLFGPVVEGADSPEAFLTAEPRSLIERGEIANVPLMFTFTTEEGAFNAGSLLKKDANGVEHLEELNERWLELAPYFFFYYHEPCSQRKQRLSESLREMYMGTESFSAKTYLQLQKMFTDVNFVNGILETVKLHRMFGPSPVYGYVYANPHASGVGNFLSDIEEFEFGATHGDDEELFLPLTVEKNSTSSSKVNDLKISKYFVKMFESFVREGVPRFKDTPLPENRNTLQPMQFLKIFEKNYCMGPWESWNTQDCQNRSNQCFDY